MCQISFWQCVTLTVAIFVLRYAFGGHVDGKLTDYQCPFNPNAYHSSNHLKYLQNCEAKLKNGKISLKCEAFASSAMELSQFTNSTAGFLVTDFMETYEDIEHILTQSSNTLCLKFMASRIQKMNFADSEIERKYNDYTCNIPKETFIPIMLIQLMNTQITYSDEYALGVAHYNKTCLQMAKEVFSNQKDPKVSFNVTECLTSVEVALRFLPSVNKFQLMAGITMEDLFTKDFLHVILVLINELFFIGYNYSIPSIAFKTGLFKYLPKEALTFLAQKNVTEVDFQENGILAIRKGDIPVMKSLLNLDLSYCQIDFIEKNAFDGVIYLQRLNLRGNKLKEISFAFNVLRNLEILYLGGNSGNDTNEFQYRNHINDSSSNLRKMDLSNMVLTHFWENLGNLSNLKHLILSNCSLHDGPSENISYLLPNLTHLNLSNNYLFNLSLFAFSGFNKLQHLDLSWNFLSNIQYSALIDALPELKFISLKANGISRFCNLTHDSALEVLDLSSNRINSWTEGRMNPSNVGLEVNLIGNNITEVNSPMLREFTSFQRIQLAGNPFDCKSCLMRDFLGWLEQTNTSTDFATTPYTCFFPKEDFNKKITEVTLQLCMELVFDWIVNVIIPVSVVVVSLIALSLAFTIYRWHIIYFVYLVRSKVQKQLRGNSGIVYKYDAFVSYCTEDRSWVVEHLIPAMEKQDPTLHLCVHERDFEAGETIMNNIIECIDNSHKSIFLLSQRFIQSQWCQWELQMAKHKLFEDKRDVLILIMLSEIIEKDTPKVLKHLISKRTYLQWSENETGQKVFWTRLRNAIGKCQCLAMGSLR